MANKGSAAKRHRQSEKRRLRNRMTKSRVKTEILKFQTSVEEKNKESAQDQLQVIIKLIDTATGKGIYHKNNAARKKSRLTKALNSLEA